jgi:hypothetical protein
MAAAGSVAALRRASPRGLGGLVAGGEQAGTPDLPHDGLAVLQRGAEAARFGSLVWFDPGMEWLAAPSGRRGRPASCP